MKRIVLLDAARGVAITLVLLFHVFPGILPNGYIGVDCFFVLAGFLAVISLRRRSGSLKEIFTYPVARFNRLAPAALFTVIAVAALATLLIPDPDDGIMRSMHAATLSLRLDEELIKNGNDYFGQAEGFNPYLHFWTISVEIKYYASILTAYVVGFLLCRCKSDSLKALDRFLVALISILSVTSFWVFLQTDSYYSFDSRFWQFGVGSILAIALADQIAEESAEKRSLSTRYKRITLIVLGLTAVATFLASSSLAISLDIKFLHLFSIILSSLAITAAVLLHQWSRSVSGFGIEGNQLVSSVAGIGVISYSLYLVHWPILVFTRWTWGDNDVLSGAVVLLFSLLAAYYLHEFVEAKRISTKNVVGLIAVALLAILPSELANRYHHRLPSLYIGKNKFPMEDLGGAGFDSEQKEAVIKKQCNDLADRSASTEKMLKYFDECKVSYPGSPSIYVFGDSSAGVLTKELSKFAESTSLGLSIHSVDRCFLPDLDGNQPCDRATHSYVKYVAEKAAPGDFVVISFNWLGMGPDPDVAKTSKAFVKYLSSLNAVYKIIVLGPYPVWNVQEPVRCFGNFGVTPRSCSQPTAHPAREAYLDVLDSLNKGLIRNAGKRLDVIDLFSVLCDEANCSVADKKDSRLIFKDDGHLSNYGAAKVVEAIKSVYSQGAPVSLQ